MSVLGQAEPLHLRLFLENVEVPVIGALVSATEGSPATAQVEMVPANSGLNIPVRSKVLLFFLQPGDVGLGTAAGAGSVTDARSLTDAGYKLLFSGEVFSMMYSKVGYGARSLVLQCLDDSNNWDTSYLYTLRYSSQAQESVVAGSTQTFLALNSNSNPFDDILSSPEQVIRQIALRGRALSKSIAGPTGMLGGLLGVLELLGGVAGKFVGITAWHTIQEARVRLLDQIATDSGTTAQQLFDFAAFDAWLTNSIGDAGTVISFREVINLICRYIYYGVAPNPVAVYRAGERNPPDWPEAVTDLVASGALASGSGTLDDEFSPFRDRILETLRSKYGWNGGAKPEAYMSSGYRSAAEQAALQVGTSREGQAPFSPHMYGYAADFALRGNGIGFVYANRPAETGSLHRRLLFWAPKYSSLDALYNSGKFTVAEVQLAKTATAFWKDVRAAVTEVAEPGVLTWGGTFSNSDAWLTLAGLGGDPVHVELAGWRSKDKVKGAIQQASAVELAGFYSSIPDRERLLTQYFRPDVWFVPPPACNVVFPEEVSNLSFMREMMRETTRLQLTTFNSVMGDDVILNQVYFAPVIEGAQSLASGGLGTASKAFIYPHEKFSGIVPKMERISDLSFYSRLSEDQRVPDVEVDKLSSEQKSLGAVDTQLDKWAARTAIFTYLSYRYDARRLSLSLKFTPRLVCGFPAVVLDRTAPEGTDAEERKSSAFSPNHFVGMVRSVTHTLNQSGGSTSVSMSHVRTHKTELDDLFASSVYDNNGLLAVQVRSVEDLVTNITVNDQLDIIEFRFLQALKKALAAGMDPSAPSGLLGPSGNVIVGPIVVETTPVVSSSGGVTTQQVVGTVPEAAVATTAAPSSRTARMILASEPSTDTFPFSKVTVTERGKTSYIPLEEAIRPPWISDEYSNKTIGALYRSLLGCPSIMDLYDDLEPGSVNGVQFSQPGIADAVEKIVDQYSRISQGGYLGASFIHELTDRDYASLEEVIGSRASPGFYWQSSGKFSGLEGSMFSWMTGSGGDAPTTQLNPTEDNKISSALDPRRDRWEKVVAYRDELLRSLGLRG